MVAGLSSMGVAPVVYNACNSKGSIDDKFSKFGEKTKNHAKHNAGSFATLVAGGAGAYAINKFADKDVIVKTGKYLNDGAAWVGKKVNKEWMTKLVDKFAKMPTKYKLIGGIALAALGVVGLISNHKNYEAGKIDQKYEDRAKIQEHFMDIV